MPREIKFRGKRVDNGEWVYGYLILRPEECLCVIYPGKGSLLDSPDVHPATVAQWTGLKDKNAKDIYSSDLIKESCPRGNIYEIVFSEGGFIAINLKEKKSFLPIYEALADMQTKTWIQEQEIIGNKWDTPDLLERSE